jgi:alpha-tubulin suppressor-like RCC1 family protein
MSVVMSAGFLRVGLVRRLMLLAAGVLPQPLAAQPAIVAVGDSSQVRVAPGSGVMVPLRVEVGSGGANVASVGGVLTWQASRLRLDSVRTAASGWTVTANTDSAVLGRVTVATFGTTGLTASAAVARAFFTALSDVGGTRLRFTPTAVGNEVGQSVLEQTGVRPLDACVAPSGKWGDVTDDGNVNVLDAQQIARFSVGLSVGSTASVSGRGDVNADGSVNVIDAQQVARFSVQLSAAARINTQLFVAPVAAGVTVSPGVAPVVRQGQLLAVVAEPVDASGNSIAGCVPLAYTTESPEVVPISMNGIASAAAPGLAWLSVTASGSVVRRLLMRVAQSNGVQRGTAAFAGGSSHSCGVDLNGAGYCWGDNTSGQLGDGTTSMSAVPRPISGGLSFAMLAASGSSTCGLSTTGTAYCWGVNNAPSVPTAVSTTLTFSTIASGLSHQCALTTEGIAYCWGNNTSGQLGDGTTVTSTSPVPVSGGRAFVDIDSEGYHTCAITRDGQGFCWGANSFGQVGDGSVATPVTRPVAVTGTHAFVMISVMSSASCGVTVAGMALCWGRNSSGQLGDGTLTDRSIPAAVSSALRYLRITAANQHACGVAATGATLCWGLNTSGQLGDGSLTNQLTPVAVSGNIAWRTLGAGATSTCGISTANTVYCWGNNQFGQLGAGLVPFRTTPVAVAGGLTFASLAAGGSSTCGLVATTLRCWGNNAFGQLGIGAVGAPRSTPAIVTGSNSYAQVVVGNNHACALSAQSNNAFCWGGNDFGQVGDSTIGENRSVPTAVSGSPAFAQIVLGLKASCGLGAGGAVRCWGRNSEGQLGDGSTTTRTSPVSVVWNGNFASITAGAVSFCGLDLAGAAFCWGYNSYGQLGNGTTIRSSTPVAVSGGLVYSRLAGGAANNIYFSNCGITTDRQTYCWGGNDKGQLGTGTLNGSAAPVAVTGNLSFVELANGGIHTCGLTDAGATYCWGWNRFGQLGDGTTIDRSVPTLVAGAPAFVALAAGERHTCGRTAAGIAYCWGNNASGELGTGESLPQGPTVVAASGITFRAP